MNVTVKKKLIDFENSKNKTLHLRNLNIDKVVLLEIMRSLHEKKEIHSISFSYNKFGDDGAMVIAEHLPLSVREIGLVDCGIGDLGGTRILDWLHTATQVQMICMEGNCFSKEFVVKLEQYALQNPSVTFIYE